MSQNLANGQNFLKLFFFSDPVFYMYMYTLVISICIGDEFVPKRKVFSCNDECQLQILLSFTDDNVYSEAARFTVGGMEFITLPSCQPK